MARSPPASDAQSSLKCLKDATSALRADRVTVNASADHTATRVREAMHQPGALYRNFVALIFWGRQEYTAILRPYMERELAIHGGAVDEIWLCMTTTLPSDLAAGHSWARDVPQVRAFETAKYSRIAGDVNYCYEGLLPRVASANGWSLRNTLVAKVDDDVVYIERHALARLAAHKIFHSSLSFQQHGLVVANVVNHGHLLYLHAALGAWPGYKNLTYHGHVGLTGRTEYVTPGNSMHYHFLEHERRGNTSAYHFRTWDLNACQCTGLVNSFKNRCAAGRYYRWAINTVAFGGGFMMKGGAMPMPFPDDNDEWWIVAGWQSGESQSGKRVLSPALAEPPHSEVVGSAVVVHYAYNRQRKAGIDRNGKFLRYYSTLGAQLKAELLKTRLHKSGLKAGANKGGRARRSVGGGGDM